MEYLFRGLLSSGSSTWLYGDLVHDAFDGISRNVIVGIRKHGFHPNAVVPESVGIYTQEKDLNGERVFIGDILKLDLETGELGVVFFSKTVHGFRIQTASGILSLYNCKKSTIVGNIYQNPDMVTEILEILNNQPC